MLKRGEHKGENGRVLVIGGSKDYIGAPALAGIAALRSGVDISVVAAPEQTAWTINSLSPDLITKKFEGEFFNWDNVKDVIELAEEFDSVLIGNGLGLEPGTQDFVKEVCERTTVPMVIDADAIKALAGAEVDNAVFTPHQTEFQILTGETLPDSIEVRAKIVQRFAKERLIFLLKGETDIIADNKQFKYNKTGNSGMTIGGTGDVLAGLTAGLLAQTKDLFNSAYSAAYLNGAIGDYLLKKKGIGFTASDMVGLIPVFKKKLKL
jgi:NAD(P)H-hydrate epimerase